jgi:hypothetical protein
MAGVNLTALTSLSNDASPAILTGPKQRINDAARVNYSLSSAFLSGRDITKMLQGGPVIQDEILLSITPRARKVKVGEVENPQVTQSGTIWTGRWRFARTHIAYTDQEILLSGGAPSAEYGRYLQQKDIMNGKIQEMYTDWANFMEDQAVSAPHATNMESSSGDQMYSTWAFVNEYTNGLYAPTGITGGTWSTVMGISPTTEPNWVPTQKTYTNLIPDDSTELLAGLRKAFRAIGVEAPSPKVAPSGNFEPSMMPASAIILCSEQGQENVIRRYQTSQSMWNNKWDPAGNPTFMGASFIYVKAKDTLAVYPTGASGAASTELDTAGTNNAGPRYEIIQPKYMSWVFHKERFMEWNGDFQRGVGQVDTYVRYNDTYGQLVCNSRRRQAIVYPAADIS